MLTAKFLLLSFLCTWFYIYWCEYAIYYAIQGLCGYLRFDPSNEDKKKVTCDDCDVPVRVLILADTHIPALEDMEVDDSIFSSNRQMYMAFKTAVKIHRPEVVFILGDITKDGYKANQSQFNKVLENFRTIFEVPEMIKMHIIAGNHDIGYHSKTTLHLQQRFLKAFGTSPVQMYSLRGNNFVMVNSMAVDVEGCNLCQDADEWFAGMSAILMCGRENYPSKCDGYEKRMGTYSKPIIMQHLPLYRESDAKCSIIDSAPYPQYNYKQPFQEGLDCLHRKTTNKIHMEFRPRLAFTAHTHHSCVRNLSTNKGVEVTVPSFSWFIRNDPSYILLLVTPNNYSIAKCPIPTQRLMWNVHLFGYLSGLLWLFYVIFRGVHIVNTM